MIVGFSKYGRGGGAGPVKYFISPVFKLEIRNPSPVVLKGDAEKVRRLIDSLPFTHKYVSGVLSFAPGELISPQMEMAIMARFEKTAFAGLDTDQYSILWVRHQHAGHHEMNFLVPRVELSTGNSMNIAPPGPKTRERFDTFRSFINMQYGLADPDDPMRARIEKLPNHIAKMKAQAKRQGTDMKEDPREIITNYIVQGIEARLINNRFDVINRLQDAGFVINRKGVDYVSVKDQETGSKYRLRGVFYEERFRSLEQVRGGVQDRARGRHQAPPERIAELAEKLECCDKELAGYNTSRYQKRGRSHLYEPGSTVQSKGPVLSPAAFASLDQYLRESLGDQCLFGRSDYQSAPGVGPTTGLLEQDAGHNHIPAEELRSHARPKRHANKPRDRATVRPDPVCEIEGDGSDRTRINVTGVLERLRSAIQGAGASLARQRGRLAGALRSIDLASSQLEHAIRYQYKVFRNLAETLGRLIGQPKAEKSDDSAGDLRSQKRKFKPQ